MLRTRIAGAAGALALLAAPAVAAAHGDGHHHHQKRHHAKKAHGHDWTGKATATIQSFTDGALTLALPSGRTYAADVTDRSVIICWKAPTPATAKTAGHGHDGGDDHGKGGDDATTTAPSTTEPPSTTTPPSTVPGDKPGRCGTDRLVTGAKVAVAKLSLKGDTAIWKKVVVVS